MFAHVHTLSFQAKKRYNFWSDAITFYLESQETNGGFLDRVNAALLARRRCAGCITGDAASLRVFRVAFHIYQHWDKDMVSMWVSHVLQQSESELHLDLRLHTYRLCDIGDGRSKDGLNSDEEDEEMSFGEEDERGVWKGWSFSFPRQLFTSAVLRSLRLSHCRLDPPAAVVLPSLETLHLTDVIDSGKTIQRLISSCPGLADVTLESCSKLTRVSVLDKRLRRLALLCCHGVVSVSLDASELRSLHYRGAVPAGSLFAFHGSPMTPSAGTIDFCGPNLSGEQELAGFRGCLDSHSITRVLQQTPNLEDLSLFLVSHHKHSRVTIPDAPAPPPVLCLKEIKLVHYQGSEERRRLAQLLLGSALLLQRHFVSFFLKRRWGSRPH